MCKIIKQAFTDAILQKDKKWIFVPVFPSSEYENIQRLWCSSKVWPTSYWFFVTFTLIWFDLCFVCVLPLAIFITWKPLLSSLNGLIFTVQSSMLPLPMTPYLMQKAHMHSQTLSLYYLLSPKMHVLSRWVPSLAQI